MRHPWRRKVQSAFRARLRRRIFMHLILKTEQRLQEKRGRNAQSRGWEPGGHFGREDGFLAFSSGYGCESWSCLFHVRLWTCQAKIWNFCTWDFWFTWDLIHLRLWASTSVSAVSINEILLGHGRKCQHFRRVRPDPGHIQTGLGCFRERPQHREPRRGLAPCHREGRVQLYRYSSCSCSPAVLTCFTTCFLSYWRLRYIFLPKSATMFSVLNLECQCSNLKAEGIKLADVRWQASGEGLQCAMRTSRFLMVRATAEPQKGLLDLCFLVQPKS